MVSQKSEDTFDHPQTLGSSQPRKTKGLAKIATIVILSHLRCRMRGLRVHVTHTGKGETEACPG